MTAKGNQFDFIVVGSGPAGCAVASRLAHSAKAPTVLLVEAGGTNNEKSLRRDGERYTIMMNPIMNWGYKTTPQPSLNHREIDYARGKGLGGSSAINFSVYDIGPADDFEEIARIAGDDSWGWKQAQHRLKFLERFHAEAPEPYREYLQPKAVDHGSSGKLQIGFPKVWEKSLGAIMKALDESGQPLNPDINSGNPLGWGICPSSAYNGLRTTSADLIVDSPKNLTVMTQQVVRRVIFEDTKAVGIETERSSYYATKEVILSCGSLDTPKLLMLSGVGPAEELERLGIPVVLDAKRVGKGLRDHIHIDLLWKRAEHTSDKWRYYRDPDAIAASIVQWDKDQTGPLADYNTGEAIGFFKSKQIYGSPEFAALPDGVRRHLEASTVPLYEALLGLVDTRDLVDPTQSEASLPCFIFLFSGESRGEVTLRSKDSNDPIIANPNLFSHPFDRRVAVEATREIMKLLQSPAFAKDTVGVVKAPKGDSDEAILAYWREHAVSTWHMSSTVKMGKAGDEDACVDKDLRVFGTTSLRVADMSIAPIQPNNHTQSTAYYIGATMGDKLAAEYNLD